MLRHVTEFVQKPMFLALCDHMSCGTYATRPVEAQTDSPLTAADAVTMSVRPDPFESFVAMLNQAGWFVNAFHQICPNHVRQMQGEQSRIMVPRVTLN